MVYEIADQMDGVIPDAIICCVGGGGLLGGILKGLISQVKDTISDKRSAIDPGLGERYDFSR
jgi:threonine dehydratase